MEQCVPLSPCLRRPFRPYCAFYKRFIYKYSLLISPLLYLLSELFLWESEPLWLDCTWLKGGSSTGGVPFSTTGGGFGVAFTGTIQMLKPIIYGLLYRIACPLTWLDWCSVWRWSRCTRLCSHTGRPTHWCRWRRRRSRLWLFNRLRLNRHRLMFCFLWNFF